MRFPKNRSNLIFLITLLSFLSKAQQFNFPNEENYLFAKGFDGRFENVATSGISIKSIEPFRLNKVKEIRLYNSNDELIAFFELDKKGNLKGKGANGRYYFGTSRKEYSQNDTLQSDAWYFGPLMVRTDTTHVWHHTYQNEDTLMDYLEYELIVHRMGGIINERNTFFTRNYLGASEKYRSDYDPSLLYLCRYENYAKGFEASVRNKSVNLNTSALKEHRFFMQYKKANTSKFYVEGEDFVEPIEKVSFFCGTTNPEVVEMESTLNSKGLLDKLYSYPSSGKFLICYASYEYYEEP